MVAFPDHRDQPFSLNGRSLGIPHLDMRMKEDGMNGIDFTRLLNTNPLLFNIPEGVADEEAGYLVQNANGELEEAKAIANRRPPNSGANVSYPWDANKAEDGDGGNDIFSLRAKSIEAVDTEQLKEDTGNLFFAVVDTRKEEIYFVNMATRDNYQKALRVIRGMPEEQPALAGRNKNQLSVQQQSVSGLQQQQQQTLSQLASRLNQQNQGQSLNQRVQQMSKNPQQVENEAYTELLFPFSHKYY